jgi:hypothetical protein
VPDEQLGNLAASAMQSTIDAPQLRARCEGLKKLRDC